MPIPPSLPNPYFSLDAGNYSSYPGSGSTWTDPVNNIQVSLSGPTSFSLDGGGSITFATSATGSFPVNANFPTGADPVSISMWIKFNQLPQSFQDPLFVIGNPAVNGCHFLFLIPNGGIGFSGNIVYDMAGPLRADYGPLYSVDGEFHLLTTTYDGTTMKSYWDGQFIPNSNFSNVGALSSYSTGYFGFFNGNSSHASYSISEVNLFDVGLSALQVLNLYNAGLPRYEKVASYDFSDPLCYPGTGTTVYDLSGNSLNLPISGATYVSAGNASYFSFDGSNDYIGKNSVTGFGNTFTLSIWSQSNGSTADCAFCAGTGLPASNAPAIGYNQATVGNINASFNWGTGLLEEPFTQNVWQNIVYTADGTNVKLYVDGTLQGTTTQGVGTWPTGGFFLGVSVDASGGVGGDYLQGKIALLDVYNVALGSTDVANVYAANSYRFDNLIYSYDFSDPACYPGTGNTVFDLSGSGIDLPVSGATYVPNGDASYFQFTGSSSYIGKTGVGGLGTVFTISIWSQTSITSSANQVAFFAGNDSISSSAPAFYYNIPTVGEISASFNYGTGLITEPYVLNTWENFVYTADGTNAKLYKNGVLQGTVSQGSGNWPNGQFYLGYFTDALNGKIGLLNVYNSALGSTAVLDLYNSQAARFDNLVASYDFSDPACYNGTGSTVFDLTANNNDLILTGSPSLTGTGTSKTLQLLRASGQSARKSTALNGITDIPMTMNVWAKFDPTTNAQAVMSYGEIAPATIPGIWSRFFNDFISFEGGVSDPVINSGIAVTNTDLFYNVIASIGESTATLYVNGSAVGTSNHTISLPAGSQFSLSGLFGTNLYDANADIAIAEVYSGAMGSTAVTQIYDSQSTRFAPAPPPYVGIVGGRQFAQGFNG